MVARVRWRSPEPEAHLPFTFQHNIVVGSGTPAFAGRNDHRDIRNLTLESDLNLYWDESPVDGARFAANGGYSAEMEWRILEGCDDVWRDAGRDRHSMFADPGFIDSEGRDLRVRSGGPAEELGIRVPDVSRAGPRPGPERTHPALQPTLPDPAIVE